MGKGWAIEKYLDWLGGFDGKTVKGLTRGLQKKDSLQ